MIENEEKTNNEEITPVAETTPSTDIKINDIKLITKSKFWDFVLGFLIFGVIDVGITYGLRIGLGSDPYFGYGGSILAASLSILIVNGFAFLYFYERSIYFMFGISTLLIYQFLLFGSCFVK
jgi:hypothetical protein